MTRSFSPRKTSSSIMRLGCLRMLRHIIPDTVSGFKKRPYLRADSQYLDSQVHRRTSPTNQQYGKNATSATPPSISPLNQEDLCSSASCCINSCPTPRMQEGLYCRGLRISLCALADQAVQLVGSPGPQHVVMRQQVQSPVLRAFLARCILVHQRRRIFETMLMW